METFTEEKGIQSIGEYMEISYNNMLDKEK